MKRYLSLLLFVLFSVYAFATHNRAGEITYRQISDNTFEITIITYTYTLSLADRNELQVSWGDNTTSVAPRVEYIYLPDNYKRNKYVKQHTFPGPGTYEIIVEDPNRNLGVGNIPNSVNVVFAIKTVLQINPMLGYNNTPVLLNYPIDKAALHQVFIHNPAAYDPDGDSLSYKLAVCLEEGGVEIPDYTLPPYDNAFYVDSITGDLVWDSPTMVGIYNVAMLIEEWREGIKIGTIIRDMQIEVKESDNLPPVIAPIENICVEAGTKVEFIISATDPNGDNVSLEATGGPFMAESSPAVFTIPAFSPSGVFTGKFTWQTNCSHVREQPYQVTFRAADDYFGLNLVDIKNMKIKVIAPAPENLSLEPNNKTIFVSWNKSVCDNAIAYEVYRRISSFGFTPGDCETGVPAYTGYHKIFQTDGYLDTSFIDNDGGQGLRQGIEYCYMVNALFADGAKSYASEEACDRLVRGIPIITNVSVENTDSQSGDIYLAWSKPTELDTLAVNGPFKYYIYRSIGIWGENLELIDSLYLNGLDDTIYYDHNLNTLDYPYSYKVELFNDELGNRFLIGAPQIASSTFINIYAEDNRLNLHFDKNDPWIDSLFVIYRLNENTLLYDSIGYSDSLGYFDTGLINGKNYCYKVKGIGTYQIDHIIHPLINFSQINCGEPIDTVPPCQPDLTVSSDCEAFINFLSWTNPNESCADDAIAYKIYYTDSYDGDLYVIATIDSANITSFTHNFLDSTLTMAGCYAVSAIDSFQNESEISKRICIDDCSYYELPNVFTPNNDGKNDFYRPIEPYRFVEKIDIKIFNRWGNLVFQTENPEINWDGTNMTTKGKVPDGVYYYTCDVYTHRLSGLEHSTLLGFIHIFSDTKKSIIEK